MRATGGCVPLVDALTELLSIARLRPMCYFWRNTKASVLLSDSGLPSMSTKGESEFFAFTIGKLRPLRTLAVLAISSTPPCYTSYPSTSPQPLADPPSSSPCPDAHGTGGYEDQHCIGEHCTLLMQSDPSHAK
jgi:hypothetical protein